MVVNTKTGEMKLTKRERDILQSAANILAQIEKHGSDGVSHKAEDAVTTLGVLLESLMPEEVTK